MTGWAVFLLSFSWLAATAGPGSAAGAAGDLAAPAAGDAVIWYLGHCGYAVRTSAHLLVFDYIELEEDPAERGLAKGFIDPAEIAGLDVCVFVSHAHVDHFDPVILGWKDRVKKLRYFFGWDRGGGDGVHSLVAPRGSAILGDIEVHTVDSRHAGVPESAFLVEVDGLTLFHGGDYQGRTRGGGPSHVVADMKYLAARAPAIDLFFLGAWTGDPYLEIIRGLRPKAILPMHWRKQEGKYADFAAELRTKGFDLPVYLPAKRGDRTEYRGGRLLLR